MRALWLEFRNFDELSKEEREKIESYCEEVFLFWDKVPELKDHLIFTEKYEFASFVRDLEFSVLASFREFVLKDMAFRLDCKKNISSGMILDIEALKYRCARVLQNKTPDLPE